MPSLLDRALNVGEAKRFKTYQKRVALIGAFEEELEHETDAELRERMDELRERAAQGEELDALLPECFAIVREVGKRKLGMRHFDVQLIGGMALHEGQIAEMKTGEGKTLTATLAVVLNSLAVRDRPPEGPADAPPERKGVHVVTVNDYLARRDAEWMSPIYDALGVSVGVLQNMQPYEEKHLAYACDVVYGTNSEFGFDYLRDNMAKDLGEKVQRGHYFGIVDEVDNILIDEARTPLIISGAPEQAADLYVKFARLAPQLKVGRTPEGMDPRMKKQFVADFDYEIDEKHKTVSITEQGVAKAERFLGIDHLYRAENGHLVNHLIQALRAEALYKRDVDYAVIDGEVKIIDEFTGRILDGRRWSEGLHQAVEAKEGVPIQEENQTLATITYQNYFRLYDKLAGMTGTALTEATEFMKIYELPVVQVPTNRPMVRADRNDQVYKTKEGKWTRGGRRDRRAPRGRPARARRHDLRRGLGAALRAPEQARHQAHGAQREARARRARGRDHRRGGPARRGHDRDEHGRPRRRHQARRQRRAPGPPAAGARRRATRPTARPTRSASQAVLPELDSQVAQARERVVGAGGLFICGTERHESRRIDNQLRGRSGRQGDPGESRFFLSAEDDLVRLFAGDRIYRILDRLGGLDDEGNEEPIEAGMLSKQIEKAQKKVEEQNFLIRKRVLEYDDVMNEQRRVIYAYRDEVLEGKSIGEEARTEVGPRDRAHDRRLRRRRLRRGLGRRRHAHGARPVLPGRRRPSIPRRSTATRSASGSYERRDAAVRRARTGARRGADARARALPAAADHRRALARAPVRHGLPARGHPPARVRPDRPAGRLQERGLQLFGDLMNSVWADFARMIFHVQVQRRGRGRQRRRRVCGARVLRRRQLEHAGWARVATPAGTAPPAPERSPLRPPRPAWPPATARRARASSTNCSRPRRRAAASSTSEHRSAATTRAGAAAARSSRSATAPSRAGPPLLIA